MLVVGAAADEAGLDREIGELLAVEPGDQLFDLGHDLGADAVAGEEEELLGHCADLAGSRMRRVEALLQEVAAPPIGWSSMRAEHGEAELLVEGPRLEAEGVEPDADESALAGEGLGALPSAPGHALAAQRLRERRGAR